MSEEMRQMERAAAADSRLARTVDCPTCEKKKPFACSTDNGGPHPGMVVAGRRHTIEVAKELDHLLHPNGKCHCANEGQCEWCKWIEGGAR